jgi:hypothetical protein
MGIQHTRATQSNFGNSRTESRRQPQTKLGRKCIQQVHRLTGHLLELLLIVAVCLVAGCDSRSKSNADAVKDPASDFKIFAGKFIPHLKSSYGNGDGRLIKAATFSDDFSFDVQKTDSLVSPYRGLLKVAARYQLTDSVYYDGTDTLIFAMQDGKWVYKDHIFSGQFFLADIGADSDTSPLQPEPIEKATAAAYGP